LIECRDHTLPALCRVVGSSLLGSQTAGGVTPFKYKSDRDIKRRAELLGMRTIVLDWWVK
jgi:hypothetical protein